jgi:hypothetical protein
MIKNIILLRSKAKHEKRNEYSKPIQCQGQCSESNENGIRLW